MIPERFLYVPVYTGDGKRGLIHDKESDFRAFVDRDDCWTEGVDRVGHAIVGLLNRYADEIPQPEYEEEE